MLPEYSQLQVCHFKRTERDLYYQWKMAPYSIRYSPIICVKKYRILIILPFNLQMTNPDDKTFKKLKGIISYNIGKMKRFTYDPGSTLRGKYYREAGRGKAAPPIHSSKDACLRCQNQSPVRRQMCCQLQTACSSLSHNRNGHNT